MSLNKLGKSLTIFRIIYSLTGKYSFFLFVFWRWGILNNIFTKTDHMPWCHGHEIGIHAFKVLESV